MAEKELRCISCNVNIANKVGSVIFKCPKCGKFDIIRCNHCKSIHVKYKCPGCGFIGP